MSIRIRNWFFNKTVSKYYFTHLNSRMNFSRGLWYYTFHKICSGYFGVFNFNSTHSIMDTLHFHTREQIVNIYEPGCCFYPKDFHSLTDHSNLAGNSIDFRATIHIFSFIFLLVVEIFI